MKIHAIIKPNSKHREGVELLDGVYVVYVKAPATEGRANARAVEIIAGYFDVAKTNVKIVKGATSKYKTIEIQCSY